MKKTTKPACSYCFDKKYYTVFRGEKGYDDFGGEAYEKPGEIKKFPCPRCTPKADKRPTRAQTLLTELIAKCGTGYFGTKNRAELLSRLQDIYLSLNKNI